MPRTATEPFVHYTAVGKSGAPRVLLIMGFAMSGEAWGEQVKGLRDRFELLYYDHPGVGDSQLEAGKSLSMSSLANHAARVLDDAGWHRDVHVVGVSMGGMVAQELVLSDRQRFASLSLIATHSGGKLAWLPTYRGARFFLGSRFGRGEGRQQSLKRLLYPPSFLKSCDQSSLQKRLQMQTEKLPKEKTVASQQFNAIRNHDTRERLSQLKLPTLIVKPGQDVLCRPTHSDHLAAAIPHAELFTIPDAGHGVLFQSADVLNRKLAEHFDRATHQRLAQVGS